MALEIILILYYTIAKPEDWIAMMTLNDLPNAAPETPGIPKYRQIAAVLEEYLKRTAPPCGEKFFNDRILAGHFETTPVTVARSLNYLVSRGLLERRVGAGTFIGNCIHTPVGKRRIGIICHEEIKAEEVYVSPVLNRFGGFWEEHRYSVVTLRGEPADYRRLIAEYELSGIMVFVPREEFAPTIQDLRDDNIPVVSIGYALPGLADVSFGTDHQAAAIAAVDYLHKLGHRKIALLTNDYESGSNAVHRRGYRQAMWERQLPQHPDWEMYDDTQPLDRNILVPQFERLCAAGELPTAILVCNLFNILHLYHIAACRGLRIPDDLSLIGFDDAEFVRHLSPPLTVMAQELDRFTLHAAEELLHMIEHGCPSGRRPDFHPVLIERGSCTKIQ